MKINRRLQNISLIIIAGTALIGFIIGSIFDYKISGKIGDFNNLFGILLTAFAPVLTLAFGVFAGATLFFMPQIQNKKWDIVFRVIGAIAVVGFTVSQIKEGIEYVDFPRMIEESLTWKVLIIVFTIILDLAIILFSRIWVKKMDEKVLIPVCIMIITTIVVCFIGCEAIKYLASRSRPRNVYMEFIKYDEWCQWQPFRAFKDGFEDCKSFVSGHATNAACLVTILPLVATLNKRENNNTIQILTIIIGSLFVFIVAFSRIIAFAHWMTDVMGGILLSTGVQALVINVTQKILEELK